MFLTSFVFFVLFIDFLAWVSAFKTFFGFFAFLMFSDFVHFNIFGFRIFEIAIAFVLKRNLTLLYKYLIVTFVLNKTFECMEAIRVLEVNQPGPLNTIQLHCSCLLFVGGCAVLRHKRVLVVSALH